MQISNEIIKILDYLGQKMGMAIDWTGSNVLPKLEELCAKFIAWEICTSWAWIGVSLVAFAVILLVKIFCDWSGAEHVVFWIGLCIIIACISTQVFDIIECNTFPEKTIYDYIQFQIDYNT